jgi:Uncharacterized conserved protein
MTDIPPALRDCDQWICWRVEDRDNEKTKVPINPQTGNYASTTNSDTWTTYQEATQTHQNSAIDTSGIGFVFSDKDPFVGIDIDETPIETATEIIETLESYTEASPSGITDNVGNFHIICKGFVPDGGTRGDIQPDNDSDAHIEMYDNKRFFTVTGDRSSIENTHTVENRAKQIYDLHREYIADTSESQSEAGGSGFEASEGVRVRMWKIRLRKPICRMKR